MKMREDKAADGRTGRPSVELIVPVYRPDIRLAALFKRIGSQTWPVSAIHVLVTADEEEFDQIRERYGRFLPEGETESAPQVRFTRVRPEEFDHGGTRHLGAAESREDVLLYMTMDAVPADDFMTENLVRALYPENEERKEEQAGPGGCVAAAYARQLPAPGCGAVERAARHFNYPKESRVKSAADLAALGIKTYFCSNVCAAYRRDIYLKQGGFDRHTIFNEDMIYAAGLIRSGYRVAYAAEARVIHSHNQSGPELFRRNFDLAVSQAKHPEIFAGVPSEGEGIRMVKQTAAHLCQTGRIWLLPKLLWQSGCKYLGYLAGRRYRSLPHGLVMAFTMNKRYWNDEREV